jgi:predicted exporter
MQSIVVDRLVHCHYWGVKSELVHFLVGLKLLGVAFNYGIFFRENDEML